MNCSSPTTGKTITSASPSVCSDRLKTPVGTASTSARFSIRKVQLAQLPFLHVNGHHVGNRQHPSILLKWCHFYATLRRIRNTVEHSVVEDDIGGSRIGNRCL